jgi:hypothetical protein
VLNIPDVSNLLSVLTELSIASLSEDTNMVVSAIVAASSRIRRLALLHVDVELAATATAASTLSLEHRDDEHSIPESQQGGAIKKLILSLAEQERILTDLSSQLQQEGTDKQILFLAVSEQVARCMVIAQQLEELVDIDPASASSSAEDLRAPDRHVPAVSSGLRNVEAAPAAPAAVAGTVELPREVCM